MRKYTTHSKLKNRVIWLLIICIVFQTSAISNAMYFVYETGFNINERIRLKCAVLQPSAVDMAKCAILCLKDTSCIALSMNQLSQCFLYHDCPALGFTTRLQDYGHLYAVKSLKAFPCLNGGAWNQARGRCDCQYGFINKYCDVMAKSCRDLNYDGYKTGTHFVNINLQNNIRSPFWGICDVYQNIDASYMLVGSNPGNYLEDRFYSDYVNGYGSSSYTWWVGLEKMLELNRAGYNILIQDIDVSIGTERISFEIRSNVTISKGIQGYTVTEHSAQTNSWGDTRGYIIRSCFETLQNIPFSASDFDRDTNSTHNCAAELGNGWWFKDCDPRCNFLANSKEKMRVPGVDLVGLSATFVRIKMKIETP